MAYNVVPTAATILISMNTERRYVTTLGNNILVLVSFPGVLLLLVVQISCQHFSRSMGSASLSRSTGKLKLLLEMNEKWGI